MQRFIITESEADLTAHAGLGLIGMALNERTLISSDLKTLMAALQKESAGDSQIPLVISADAQTPHQYVITAMDAAGQLGFNRLRLTTSEAEADAQQ